MLEKKVKLIRIGELRIFPKKENGNFVKDADGNDVVSHLRQIVFESTDYKKDVIPVTLFHDEATNFSIPVGTEGTLHFVCEAHERKADQDKESRVYAEIKIINFDAANKS